MKKQIKVRGKIITVQALKKEISEFERVLHRIAHINSYRNEVHGVIGGEESSGIVWSPCVAFDNKPHPAVDEFIEKMPTLVMLGDIERLLPEINELFHAEVSMDDKRITPEQQEENRRFFKEQNEKSKTKQEEFDAAAIDIPDGMMALYIQRYFNDSDSMTDYYCPHHSLGNGMVIAIIPKGRETQARARAALAQYPELAELKWEWHTEKWSGGHGNFLESEIVGSEEKSAYDGRTEVNWWYEIQFNGYTKKMLPYENFDPNNKADIASDEATQVEGITVRENEALNGVEVIFPEKPARSVLIDLKAHGFRFHPRKVLWYAKRSESRLTFAHSLAN